MAERPTATNFRFTRRRDSSGDEGCGCRPEIVRGKWENDAAIMLGRADLGRVEKPRSTSHMPSDSVANRIRGRVALFQCFIGDRKRWAFISFIVGGDVSSTKWAANRNHLEKRADRLGDLPRGSIVAGEVLDGLESRIRDSDAVVVLPDGDYQAVRRRARKRGKQDIRCAPGASRAQRVLRCRDGLGRFVSITPCRRYGERNGNLASTINANSSGCAGAS